MLKGSKIYYKMNLVCTLVLRALRRYFGAESQDFVEKSLKVGKIVSLFYYNMHFELKRIFL
jgi:hypothetical protein